MSEPCPRVEYEPMTDDTVSVIKCELPKRHTGSCWANSEQIFRVEDLLG